MSGKTLLSGKSNIYNERLRRKEDLNKSRHYFPKSEIKEIRKNLYQIESKKYISTKKLKEIEKGFLDL